MDRVFLSAVAAISLTFSAQADVMNDNFVGCKDASDMSSIVEFLSDGDVEAFKKFATEKVVSGDCILLEKGQQVKLKDFSILSGKACVRPRGETSCYYIPAELIMTPK